MRVTINLASRQFADIAPALKNLRIAMAALAGVAVLLLIALHFVHDKAEIARAHEHSLDAKVSQLRQEQQGYQATMHQPENALAAPASDRCAWETDRKFWKSSSTCSRKTCPGQRHRRIHPRQNPTAERLRYPTSSSLTAAEPGRAARYTTHRERA